MDDSFLCIFTEFEIVKKEKRIKYLFAISVIDKRWITKKIEILFGERRTARNSSSINEVDGWWKLK